MSGLVFPDAIQNDQILVEIAENILQNSTSLSSQSSVSDEGLAIQGFLDTTNIFSGSIQSGRASDGSHYRIIAGLQEDRVDGSTGNDTILGLKDNDILLGGQGNDIIHGGQNNDLISGDDGDDTLFGDKGEDTVFGRKGDDVLFGNQGQDSLDGGEGDDRIHGGQDNDIVVGGEGDDTLYGDKGDDIVIGQADDDLMFGNQGQDTLDGGEGDDTLYGGQGNDSIVGGEGNDILYGDKGNDRLIGGEGQDSFVYSSKTHTEFGLDTLVDFSTVEDKVVLSAEIFSALGINENGQLLPGELQTIPNFSPDVANAGDANLVYDPQSGLLYYINEQGLTTPLLNIGVNLTLSQDNFLIDDSFEIS